MSLAPGARLGSYEIIAAIGAGGMGEVYHARDTRLGRNVAIKVLPEHFVGDHERTTRFEREAQALAALNHPNIAQIYGVESIPSADDAGSGARSARTALVMEFVQGDDLAAQIGRGPIATTDAIGIARQIGLALEAAHALQIVHRDLKPANVKVTSDGTVKVLDFGLARMGAPDTGSGAANPQNSPTMTSPATALGVILGTAAYMSPEQARGRPVDKRADIWAFGCVLYEMLAGNPAFPGDTVTDVLAAVVTKEPDWSALPADAPGPVRTILRRCLQKDPRQRLHDIADARIELDAPGPETQPSLAASPAAAGRKGLSWALAAALAVGAAVIGGLGGFVWRGLRELPPPDWTATRLGGPSIAYAPRLSPDGHLLAFLAIVDGQSQVGVMKPGAASWTVVTHDRTRGLVDTLQWAADGSHIFYDRFTDIPNGIYSVPALGGDERLVLENAAAPVPLDDGSVLFWRINPNRFFQLHRLWPGTGKIDSLPLVATDATSQRTQKLLDANHLLVLGRQITGATDYDSLQVLDLRTNQMQSIAPDLGDNIAGLAVDSTDRTILATVLDGSMWRVIRFSPDRPAERTQVLSLLESPTLAVGPDGSLIVGLMDRPSEIVRIDHTGGSIERVTQGHFLRGGVIALSNGNILMPTRVGVVGRVLVVAPGKEPVRFVQTDEETRGPLTQVPDGRVALLIGNNPPRDIALVAGDTGRLLKRFKAPDDIGSLAASPDGKTLYFTANGTVSAMSVEGGPARAFCAGDSIAVDPDTGDVIAKLDEKERFRLVRCSPAGAPPRDIEIKGNLRLVSLPLLPGSIRNGRMLLSAGSADSWYWFVGSLNLASGQLDKVKVNYFTDFHYATWTADGQILGTGMSMRAALWRFDKRVPSRDQP